MTWGRIVTAIFFLLVTVIVVGHLIGQPLLLAFVETGSMQPTLAPGDGFVSVPPLIAGEIGVGDVIIYRAQELGGGGLTTHRVIAVTDSGFVTAGDANAFTDQAAGEPPVSREQVVAVGTQIGGHLLVIPELGTAIGAVGDGVASVQRVLAELLGTRSLLGVQGLALLVLAASIVGYVADVVFATPRKRRVRTVSRGTGYRFVHLVLVVAVIVALAATVAMVGPSGTETYTFDSVEPAADVRGGIEVGEQRTVTATVTNAGLVPMFVLFETDEQDVGVPTTPVLLWPRQDRTVSVTLTAPTDPGRYYRTVDHHRYLAVLPPTILAGLHAIDPWLAVLAVDGVIVSVFLVVGWLVIGWGRVRVREARERRGRWTIRRWFWGRETKE